MLEESLEPELSELLERPDWLSTMSLLEDSLLSPPWSVGVGDAVGEAEPCNPLEESESNEFDEEAASSEFDIDEVDPAELASSWEEVSESALLPSESSLLLALDELLSGNDPAEDPPDSTLLLLPLLPEAKLRPESPLEDSMEDAWEEDEVSLESFDDDTADVEELPETDASEELSELLPCHPSDDSLSLSSLATEEDPKLPLVLEAADWDACTSPLESAAEALESLLSLP